MNYKLHDLLLWLATEHKIIDLTNDDCQILVELQDEYLDKLIHLAVFHCLQDMAKTFSDRPLPASKKDMLLANLKRYCSAIKKVTDFLMTNPKVVVHDHTLNFEKLLKEELEGRSSFYYVLK